MPTEQTDVSAVSARRPSAGAYPCWSPADDEKLRSICIERSPRGEKEWKVVAASFPGRSLYAVRQRYLILRMQSVDTRPPPRKKKKGRTVNGKSRKMPSAAIEPMQPPPALPPAPPRSLTAFVMGDPLPGRSALDAKRAAEVAR